MIVSLLGFKPKKGGALKNNEEWNGQIFFFWGALYYVLNYNPKTGYRDFKSFNIRLVIRCFDVWNC